MVQRETERWKQRQSFRETERKRNTRYKRERLLRQLDRREREREREKVRIDCTPTRRPAQTSVFIRGIVSISPGIEAFISLYRCLMSWGRRISWYWRFQGLAGVSSVRDNWQITVLPGLSPLQVEGSLLFAFPPSLPSLLRPLVFRCRHSYRLHV